MNKIYDRMITRLSSHASSTAVWSRTETVIPEKNQGDLNFTFLGRGGEVRNFKATFSP